MDQTKLKNKNILITAGAQGIGEAITQHFIDSGAHVAIHYFSSAERAKELKEYAVNKGQKASLIASPTSPTRFCLLPLRGRYRCNR